MQMHPGAARMVPAQMLVGRGANGQQHAMGAAGAQGPRRNGQCACASGAMGHAPSVVHHPA
eukprot:3976282-Prymnesium_polylepis.1